MDLPSDTGSVHTPALDVVSNVDVRAEGRVPLGHAQDRHCVRSLRRSYYVLLGVAFVAVRAGDTRHVPEYVTFS